MKRKNRSSEEIDIETLQALHRNPGGIAISRLIRLARIHGGYQKRLLKLQEKGLLEIAKQEEKERHGCSGRRLLSNNPKIVIRRIVKITEKGKMFLKNKTKVNSPKPS